MNIVILVTLNNANSNTDIFSTKNKIYMYIFNDLDIYIILLFFNIHLYDLVGIVEIFYIIYIIVS